MLLNFIPFCFSIASLPPPIRSPPPAISVPPIPSIPVEEEEQEEYEEPGKLIQVRFHDYSTLLYSS